MGTRLLILVTTFGLAASVTSVQNLIHTDPRVRQAALNFEALFEQYRAVSKEKVNGN
jgi:hypothetical protein